MTTKNIMDNIKYLFISKWFYQFICLLFCRTVRHWKLMTFRGWWDTKYINKNKPTTDDDKEHYGYYKMTFLFFQILICNLFVFCCTLRGEGGIGNGGFQRLVGHQGIDKNGWLFTSRVVSLTISHINNKMQKVHIKISILGRHPPTNSNDICLSCCSVTR